MRALHPSRFKLVVLATFPRSGTTWTRALLRAASGLVAGIEGKKALATRGVLRAWPKGAGRPPATLLRQLLALHKATAREASDAEIVRFLRANQLVGVYNIAADVQRFATHSTGVRDASKVAEVGRLCGDLLQLDPDELTLDEVPPIVVKSHAPTILHKKHRPTIELLLSQADVRVHTVRNALDNIVSRFHGNPAAVATRRNGTAKETQWDDIVLARERNTTTDVFDAYAKKQAYVYASHHGYWMDFARQHGASRPSVWFRYESLATDAARMLPALLERIGFRVDPARVKCAVSAFPVNARRSYPEHARFYTAAQRAAVVAATSPVDKATGYFWADDGAALALTDAPLTSLSE